ncbi:MAG: hypothetical protein MUO95_04315 [Methanoregula sp.]|jgi:hypothetical protein|nr:hypothetical protein [Methanoregula sp.]
MNTVVNQTETSPGYWEKVSNFSASIGSKVPTFDKSMDAYFDQNFVSIIEEWDLLTDSDLHKLEYRLSQITNEISTLFAEKMVIEKRVGNLDILVSSLEGSK